MVDFLDQAAREDFNIVETELVSDHPFDANALAIVEAVGRSGGMVLDCGSGKKDARFEHVVQMEIRRYPYVDVLAVNQRLPFADAVFDAVFSLDVLEHVTDPFASAEEIARVLRPGGVLYVDVPFLQVEHGHPHHYFNATRMGLRRLFEGRLELESHHVPLSGHPIFALYKVVELYDGWLSEAARARFRSLTLGELQEREVLDWLDDPIVREMAVEGRWITASSTQALFRKPGGGAGGSSGGLAVWARDLPGFPEFEPAGPAGAASAGPAGAASAGPASAASAALAGPAGPAATGVAGRAGGEATAEPVSAPPPAGVPGEPAATAEPVSAPPPAGVPGEPAATAGASAGVRRGCKERIRRRS